MAFTTINDPSKYFHIQLYNGNGSTQAITNDANAGDFQPDWLWSKSRNDGFDNITRDSSRGADARLLTHSDAAEGGATGTASFDSDGFTLDSTNTVNKASDNYVAWQWKANGGTTSTLTAGTNIDTTVQANTTAGFSIITYTGTGTDNDSIAHGLGAVPHFFIIKNRDETNGWQIYHQDNTSDPETDVVTLNTTNATTDNDTVFSDAAPSATVITLGTNDGVSKANVKYVCYAFTEKQGYSRFGHYIGNGTTDGAFVYTGFKPAWLMVKEVVSGGGWGIWDNKRQTFNSAGTVNRLLANSSNAEDASNDNRIDFLSNGFKVRTSSGGFNQNATNVLYIAFAESPFVSSTGVPTTAR